MTYRNIISRKISWYFLAPCYGHTVFTDGSLARVLVVLEVKLKTLYKKTNNGPKRVL